VLKGEYLLYPIYRKIIFRNISNIKKVVVYTFTIYASDNSAYLYITVDTECQSHFV
jgi:hypothetical protein